MTDHRYCVILAGGIGSRFWPLSREYKPKQFLRVWNQEKSFIRYTFERMARTIPVQNIYVATLGAYKEMVMEHLPELPEKNIVLEPYGRNTAPTIAYTAHLLRDIDPEAVMVAVPADHDISDNAMFDRNMVRALDYAASHDVLLTLGIVPSRPDTNFGYVQVSGGKDAWTPGDPVPAKTFTEKPDAELAKVFVDSGEFLWNSGIFVWKVGVVLDEIRKCCPEIYNVWKGWDKTQPKDREAFVEKAYSDSMRISIDYAVMEKTDKAWVFPAKFKWADIGNWESLYEYLAQHDSFGNASDIDGKSLLREGRDNIIYSDGKGKLIAIRGLEDYIVIDTDDVLLICPRGEKKLKEFLSELAMPEYADYR